MTPVHLSDYLMHDKTLQGPSNHVLFLCYHQHSTTLFPAGKEIDTKGLAQSTHTAHGSPRELLPCLFSRTTVLRAENTDCLFVVLFGEHKVYLSLSIWCLGARTLRHLCVRLVQSRSVLRFSRESICIRLPKGKNKLELLSNCVCCLVMYLDIVTQMLFRNIRLFKIYFNAQQLRAPPSLFDVVSKT